jgi:hypothetical protein
MAPVGQMSCPTGAIQSFPLKMGITASDTLYDTVSEALTVSFQWAARTTPPRFIQNFVSTLDEIGAGNTSLSTLRFQNNNYTISNVEIIQPSHKAWILPVSGQGSNYEDIAITFASNDTKLNTQYITFVIPIIRTSSPIQPTYFKGLSDPNSNGTFSLGQLLPTNTRTKFAYYSTCLSPSGAGLPSQNMYVFVCISGLSVSDALMKNLLTKVSLGQFSSKITAPFMTRLTGPSVTISNAEILTQYVMTTTELLNYDNFKGQYSRVNMNANTRVDDTSSYKCVPIDPEDAVTNGQLTVNLDNGEVLSQVLAERDSTRSLHSLFGNLDRSRFVKLFEGGLGIFMGVLLCLLFILFGYFAVRKLKGGSTTTATTATTATGTSSQIMTVLTNISVYGFVVLIAAFGGFVIGAML